MTILQPNQLTKTETPWGHEIVWASTDSYVGKLLHLERGQSIGRHYHTEKQETLYLLSGTVLLTLQSGNRIQVKTMTPTQAYQIPPLLVHWLKALEDSNILEVASAELDDLVGVEERNFTRRASAL